MCRSRQLIDKNRKHCRGVTCRDESVGYIVPPNRNRQLVSSLTTWLVTPRSIWESAFV